MRDTGADATETITTASVGGPVVRRTGPIRPRPKPPKDPMASARPAKDMPMARTEPPPEDRATGQVAAGRSRQGRHLGAAMGTVALRRVRQRRVAVAQRRAPTGVPTEEAVIKTGGRWLVPRIPVRRRSISALPNEPTPSLPAAVRELLVTRETARGHRRRSSP